MSVTAFQRTRREMLKERNQKESIKDEEFIQNIEEAHELAVKEDKINSFEKLKLEELKEIAKDKKIEGYSKMKKDELISVLVGE